MAKLLIDERFVQFIELVDQSEFKTGELPVRCSDLQGFWDMVDFQVIDVKKKFKGLEKLKANNYVEEMVVFKPPAKKAALKPIGAAKEVFFHFFLFIYEILKIISILEKDYKCSRRIKKKQIC